MNQNRQSSVLGAVMLAALAATTQATDGNGITIEPVETTTPVSYDIEHELDDGAETRTAKFTGGHVGKSYDLRIAIKSKTGEEPPTNPMSLKEMSRRSLSTVPNYEGREADIAALALTCDVISLGLSSGSLTIKELADAGIQEWFRAIWGSNQAKWLAWHESLWGDDPVGLFKSLQRNGTIKEVGDFAAAFSDIADGLREGLDGNAMVRGSTGAKAILDGPLLGALLRWFLEDPVRAINFIRELIKLFGATAMVDGDEW